MTFKEYLFSKKYGSLRYNLSFFFKYYLPFSKEWNAYHNPWYHWWKVRKYFKRPKAHLIKGKNIWFFGLYANRNNYNRILHIQLSGLGWKDKFDSPRHEWDPFINIVFFKHYHIIWIFNWIDKKDEDSDTRSMATWEAILDYLYYKVPIDKVLERHVWCRSIDDNKYSITIKENMK